MSILSVTKTDNSVILKNEKRWIHYIPITEQIIRCVYSAKETPSSPSSLVEDIAIPMSVNVSYTSKDIVLSFGQLEINIDAADETVCWNAKKNHHLFFKESKKELCPINLTEYSTNGEKPQIHKVKTVDGERNFVENLKEKIIGTTYRAKLNFLWQKNEGIFGLGQGESGIYNHRGNTRFLYHHNMRIPMPFFISDKMYGIFFDCGSLMTFNDTADGSYVLLDAVDQLDYYVIIGYNFDEIIRNYRHLTGDAAMLPKWAWGYMQSKEYYHNEQELLDTASQYRERGIPLDCIIQDWNSWEPGKWGEKILDPQRYKNIEHTINSLHDMNVHTMISIWPNMSDTCSNYEEMAANHFLLADDSTYNAFSPDARNLYWEQACNGLFKHGFDAWWCDSSEPFAGPDWNGEMKREEWERYFLVGGEHKKFLGQKRANLYPLAHAKGIYENQRKYTNQKRVLNLTRSGYSSSQKYGVILWSGDISASWETMKKQIVEGLNMALSGYPYWTLDIGGFFTVNEKWQNRGCGKNNDSTPKWFWHGNYDDGVNDRGYCELYTRWLELAVFLPIFRSHGTDTPREVWNFGEKGSMFYDAICKFIRLRYKLLPYIYSLAYAVHKDGESIMRSLLFDYIDDPIAKLIKDQYMFGRSFLVCPVTYPMYYEKESQKIERKKTHKCYLPKGNDWYDYWSGICYEGGKWISCNAPIDIIPLFVKEGSIIPEAEGLQHTGEIPAAPMTITIFPGRDAVFTLYEDEGDGYGYEKGLFSQITIKWNDATQCLTLDNRYGYFPGMEEIRTFIIILRDQKKSITYQGQEISIFFK